MLTRRKLVVQVLGASVLKAVAGAPPQKGWSIHIAKVHDLLKLRKGGPLGPLIHWDQRGDGHYSWVDTDPEEDRDLGSWFKPEEESIQLAAELDKRDHATGDLSCHLSIRFNGKEVDPWTLTDKEGAKTFRRT
jgi:hypothetical protein